MEIISNLIEICEDSIDSFNIYKTQYAESNFNPNRVSFMTSMMPRSYKIKVGVEYSKIKLVGILFAHPKGKIAKNEIIELLDKYHIRSGHNVDFYLAGYGRKGMVTEFPDIFDIENSHDSSWVYSELAFDRIRRDIEGKTNWSYGGETELILTNLKYDMNSNQPIFDFAETIICRLDEMIRQSAIESTQKFFNAIFKFGEEEDSKNPAYAFSDYMGMKKGKSALLSFVLDKIGLKKFFSSTKHFAIQNIQKKRPKDN